MIKLTLKENKIKIDLTERKIFFVLNKCNLINLFNSDWTPASLNPVYWWDATDPDTISQTEGKVTSWRSKGNITESLIQAVEASKPEYIDNTFIRFDGIDDNLKNTVTGIDQPHTVIIIGLPRKTDAEQYIIGTSVDYNFIASSANKLIIDAGGELFTDDDEYSVDLISWLTIMNGASSNIYKNNTLKEEGDVGEVNLSGTLCVGSKNDDTLFAQIDIFEIIIIPGVITKWKRNQLQNYIDNKYTQYEIDIADGKRLQDGAATDSYITDHILASESVYNYTTKNKRIGINKRLPIDKKYISFAWADFYMEDATTILTLNAKYGFSTTHYWQPLPASDNYLISFYTGYRNPNKIEPAGCFSANHTYCHYTHTQLCPLYDGRNTPSNDDLRLDRGDGRNQWGHPVDETLVTSLGVAYCDYYMQLEAATYNKQWQNITDDECQQIRAYLSVFMAIKPPQHKQKLLEGLDYLSNRYLGTTGYSVKNGDYDTRIPNTADGGEPSDINPILGGIFQGFTSTANHEVWERILEIEWQWKEEVHGISRKQTFWTTSGGVSHFISYFEYGYGHPSFIYQYVDREKTQILDGEAKFTSAVFGTRSFIDILREKGYRNTMAAEGVGVRIGQMTGMSRIEAQRIYKRNQYLNKKDLLGDGYVNSFRIHDMKAETADINNALASTDVVKYLYDLTATDARWDDGSAFSTISKFSDFINMMNRYIAWGIIPEGVGDSSAPDGEKEASFAIFIEAFYQYCLRANITVISQEQAMELAFDNEYSPSNYWPNPDFEITTKTIFVSDNIPDYPDGWNGGVVIEEEVDGDTEKCLYIDNSEGGDEVIYFTRQYSIKPSGILLSFWAFGKGIMKIKKIRNIHLFENDNGDEFENWIEIIIDNTEWELFINSDEVEDAPFVEYEEPVNAEEKTTQYYFKGYDNKVCGIHIELIIQAGDEIKLSKPTIIIS